MRLRHSSTPDHHHDTRRRLPVRSADKRGLREGGHSLFSTIGPKPVSTFGSCALRSAHHEKCRA
jgi:hypothetical protein